MCIGNNWLVAAALGLLLSGCAGIKRAPAPEVTQALAPAGKLRAGLLSNNPVHATKDPISGELKGVAIDLGNELARRLGVQLEVVTYRTAAEIVNSAPSGQWDIVFLGIVPERAKTMDFSAPYAQIEMGYLVPKDSSISTVSEVDRAGIRIAVQEKGAADVLLTPTIKHAALVRGSTFPDGIGMLRSGTVDAIAGIKTFLFPASDQLPGSRVLDGRIAVEEIGIGVPKGRDVSAAYVRKFIDEAKSTGLVKAAIDRAKVRGLAAAP
jgi:polar amino acid transport system substrate-binding protein